MLFDENIGFMPFDLGINLGMPNMEEKPMVEPTKNVLSSEEGFLRGNMYKDEFKPYKNYTYRKIEPLGKREKLLFEIMQYDFAINDLNLCLDLHPDDASLYQLFQKYVKLACDKYLEYGKLYGPLLLDETNGSTFNWISDPWPWNDKEDAKYV